MVGKLRHVALERSEYAMVLEDQPANRQRTTLK
jgi:hypothetical protein